MQGKKDDSLIYQASADMQLSSVESSKEDDTVAYGSAVMGVTDGLISSEPTLKRRKFQNFIIATTVLVDNDL